MGALGSIRRGVRSAYYACHSRRSAGIALAGAPLLLILRITDLPEAAGLVAPREIVSLDASAGSVRLHRSIYALYGKKDAHPRSGQAWVTL